MKKNIIQSRSLITECIGDGLVGNHDEIAAIYSEELPNANGLAQLQISFCSPKLRKKIDDYLREDTVNFLKYIGKPTDYWDSNL